MRVAVALAAVLLVAGCGEEPSPLDDKVAKSNLIKVCSDGTWIGRDPRDGQLVALKHWSEYRKLQATVAPGTDPETICPVKGVA